MGYGWYHSLLNNDLRSARALRSVSLIAYTEWTNVFSIFPVSIPGVPKKKSLTFDLMEIENDYT